MSVFMVLVKRMKSEMGDIYTDPIKFGLFSFNLVVSAGTFGYQVYDIFFKETTKAIVQLTMKEFLRNNKEFANRKEVLPESISLWASKDDDELIRKYLKVIHKVMEEDPDEFMNYNKKGGLWNDFSRRVKPWITKDDVQKKGQYTKMWNGFSDVIKFGIIKSEVNRNEFASFLRFQSTKSKGELISLDKYLSGMKLSQDKIFYLIVDKTQLEKSPFLEVLKKKDFEVLVFTDDIDQYVVQHLPAYKGKTFHDISRDGFKFDKENLENSFEELVRWWTKLLDDRNVDVKINHLLLSDTACAVVKSNYGLTSFLERLPHSESYMRARRVLEINPRHPMIKDLCQQDPKDENVQRIAIALYGIALIESGLLLTDSEISTFHPFRFAQSSLNNIGGKGVKKEEPEIEGRFLEKVFPLPWRRSSTS